MIRNSNPYSEYLKESRIFIKYKDSIPTDVASNVESLLVKQRVNIDHVKENGFSLSHEFVDGYGLVYLSKYLGLADCSKLSEDKGLIVSTFGDYAYKMAWFPVENNKDKKTSRTTSQIFLSNMIEKFEELKGKHIAVVAKADNHIIDNIDDAWGNSMALLPIETSLLHKLCNGSVENWRKTLSEKAIRTIKILKRKKIGMENFNSLIFSTLGNLSNFPFAPKNDLSGALMGATPIYKRCGNIFSWKIGNIQYISVCADPEHWIVNKFEEIVSCWGDNNS